MSKTVLHALQRIYKHNYMTDHLRAYYWVFNIENAICLPLLVKFDLRIEPRKASRENVDALRDVLG